MKSYNSLSRRRLIQSGGAALATGLGASSSAYAAENTIAPEERRFLFVIGANGGASIVDSYLPILDSESSTGANTFSAAQLETVNGSNFRCPIVMDNKIQGAIPLGDQYAMSSFLQKHSDDMAVVTQTCSSVNHQIASRRAVSGNNINGGRTLQEAVAMQYGGGLLLPNANMASDDFGGVGTHPDTPASAKPEVIADPRYMAFATHGYKGINKAPASDLIDKARTVRQSLDSINDTQQAFNARERVQAYLHHRDNVMPELEKADLINKLLLVQSSPAGTPVTDFGLEASAAGQALLSHFPNMQADPFEAATAMAYLLITSGVSCTATIEPSDSPFLKPGVGAITSPLAFDWSHLDHRAAQNAMWGRVMNMTDQLISLLKQTEFANGQSYWDRSVIYIATDFGREKLSSGGSGHDVNNGNVLLSPFIKGNRVYGGVDADTARTYGFDPQTGDPDLSRNMNEGDIYSAVCHALDIDFETRRDMPCMVKV